MQRPSIPLLLAAAALAIGCAAAEHEDIVHVIAEQAPGLKKNAPVQYRGVEVGLVKEVYFTNGGVRIDVLIQRNDVPIRAQDTVRLTSVGPFGQQVVDIRPGPLTAPLVPRGATLPKVRPETTIALPVGVWRSVVRTLGLAEDSSLHDSVVRAPYSSRAKKR